MFRHIYFLFKFYVFINIDAYHTMAIDVANKDFWQSKIKIMSF